MKTQPLKILAEALTWALLAAYLVVPFALLALTAGGGPLPKEYAYAYAEALGYVTGHYFLLLIAVAVLMAFLRVPAWVKRTWAGFGVLLFMAIAATMYFALR